MYSKLGGMLPVAVLTRAEAVFKAGCALPPRPVLLDTLVTRDPGIAPLYLPPPLPIHLFYLPPSTYPYTEISTYHTTPSP